ncbi:MAG: pyruvate dehydrogenase (acetyl-transferring), homodimeric type [Chromatiaceae bacterium]|nr:pyruvate dehydrogenase (acetyl-transferring), homodimeric type [Chromatiaceae bacterium]
MAVKPDIDPQETQEWIEALDSVLENEGPDRAHFLLEKLVDKARRSGAYLPYSANTAYLNTIPLTKQDPFPGDRSMERRIRSFVRWNAMAMVVQANRIATELGGHIASFASSATLIDIAYNHFFRATNDNQEGDLVFFQGHSAPGVYARAFLEGRISEEQMHRFRQEVDGGGLSSYPHPWLMPNFWQFPTVSMGLGPIMAIYQARFMRYLHDRGLQNAGDRKVWAFMGDGEMDEPESLGAISLAARERLDNLVFVVNCNLQRLDGPVRGNGKIIQELEAVFRGAGWNVIKVIWGGYWDPLLARDKDGLLLKRMEECVDGDYQAYKAHGGAYVREHFFGKYPQLAAMVANMSDEDIWRLNRGGHDPIKVYAAYAAATRHKGQPTVILAKTVKGYGMGEAGEGQNITHSQKKMGEESLRAFRDRFNIPIPDDQISSAPFFKPPAESPEMNYLHERRAALGGYMPSRRSQANLLTIPPLETFKALLEGSGDREMSTTMAFVRFLTSLTRDKVVGKFVVPIVPDEARTFGMEGMFRQLGIYSSVGQLYKPVDSDQVMYYREDTKGQILQEGINEAGAMSSWIAAATSYSNNGVTMIPFYIYYSMFGFQRVGDLAWASGDMQARGFLLGGTAGRTTLAGEGLQHQDGHSHLQAAFIPNCRAYDPAFAYELAVILHDGMKKMYEQQHNVFYYVTVMNENYIQPPMPEGAEADIIRGMYLYRQGSRKKKRVQLMGSGTILREVIAAAALLEDEWNIAADVWSVTSFTELRREAIDAERWNMLHPMDKPRVPFVTQTLDKQKGPVVAATDYMRSFPEQILPYLGERHFIALGTDGYGRSDMRSQLRKFFEVNRHYVVVAALKALADIGEVDGSLVSQAIKAYKIDPDKPNPATV